MRSSICIEGVHALEEDGLDDVGFEPVLQDIPSESVQEISEFIPGDPNASLREEPTLFPEDESTRSLLEVSTTSQHATSPVPDNLLSDITNFPTSRDEPGPSRQYMNEQEVIDTPSPTNQNSLAFIASPTIFINRDYDLQSISDIEGVLCNIENYSDAVTTEQANRTPLSTPISTLSRKRKRDEKSWKDVKNKAMKNSGQEYVSKQSKKQNIEKTMRSACACRLKCYEKFDENLRKNIFTKFWAIGDHERQWEFIIRYVKNVDIKKMTLQRAANRTQTLIYSLPSTTEMNDSIKVCKIMFINTLSITQQVVYTAIEKLSKELKDLRGKHSTRPKKMLVETERSIIEHINDFNRVESHYVRKDTQKEYLEETLNVQKMHRLYLEWLGTKPEYIHVIPATKRQYEFIFNSKFNLSFHKPKKDQCEICMTYKNADDTRKLQLKDEYEKHISAKNLVRQIKDEEKQGFDKNDSVVACFDLEKVLSIPQSEVGIFHYKRKYPIYNFTVYDITRKKGFCFVWHLQIAKRGAIEISSCLWSYIQTQVGLGIKRISFYSDSCTGQNRNRYVFAMMALASRKYNLQITHRFFEKGHSQSEGDSMHSVIERAKKNHTIYTPDQMYGIIENAKVSGSRYVVKQMTQAEIFDFKDLIKGKNWFSDVNSAKIYWSKVKEVCVSPDRPDQIKFRYFLDQPYQEMQMARPNSRRRRGEAVASVHDERLKPAYSGMLPVPGPLHKDLISLCDSGAIPEYYQAFYRNLVPTDNPVTGEIDEDEDL